MMEYLKNKKGITVRSDYWTVEHEAGKGGALSSIRFKNGSGRNILVSPFASYIRKKEKAGYVFYGEIYQRKPVLLVRREENQVVVENGGQYASESGTVIPVTYKRSYRYQEFGLIRASLEMTFQRDVGGIIEIGISSVLLSKNLNVMAWRPSPKMDPSCSYQGMCQWHEFAADCPSYADDSLFIGRYLPLYFCAFEPSVEGVELFLGDEADACNRVFSKDDGQAFCGVFNDAGKNARHARFESYGNWRAPIRVNSGSYSFSYYIGLPFSKGRRHVHQPLFHAAITSPDKWPTEKQLDTLAESGVKLFRLHNDYCENGQFWHDGCYPPYDKENMKKMDWVIDQTHARGMKIVPYFSVKELHPECLVYGKHVKTWHRAIDKKLTVLHNLAGSGEFGAQMCLKSGWLEYRKRSIDMVLSRHAFDGVYYDGGVGMFCCHPRHAGGKPHTDIDELLDLLWWTRRRVGPSGIIFIHLSGAPMMVAENIADLVITHEEYVNYLPLPGRFNPEVFLAGITGHHICVPPVCNSPETRKRFVLSGFAEGLWTYPLAFDKKDATLCEMAKFRWHELASYSYEPAHRRPVAVAGHQDVAASLYWNKRSALIYLANLDKKDRDVSLTVDLKSRGWNVSEKIKIVCNRGGIHSTVGRLASRGFALPIPGLSSQLLEIQKEDGNVRKINAPRGG